MHTIILINSYENKYISSNDEIFLMNSNNLPFNRLQTEKYKKKKRYINIFLYVHIAVIAHYLVFVPLGI